MRHRQWSAEAHVDVCDNYVPGAMALVNDISGSTSQFFTLSMESADKAKDVLQRGTVGIEKRFEKLSDLNKDHAGKTSRVNTTLATIKETETKRTKEILTHKNLESSLLMRIPEVTKQHILKPHPAFYQFRRQKYSHEDYIKNIFIDGCYAATEMSRRATVEAFMSYIEECNRIGYTLEKYMELAFKPPRLKYIDAHLVRATFVLDDEHSPDDFGLVLTKMEEELWSQPKEFLKDMDKLIRDQILRALGILQHWGTQSEIPLLTERIFAMCFIRDAALASLNQVMVKIDNGISLKGMHIQGGSIKAVRKMIIWRVAQQYTQYAEALYSIGTSAFLDIFEENRLVFLHDVAQLKKTILKRQEEGEEEPDEKEPDKEEPHPEPSTP